jgi:hypothetical protein
MDSTPNELNPDWTQPRLDSTPTGLNPNWDSTPTGINPDWDTTPNGLNPDWDSTLNGLNSEWDSTSNSSQHRMVYNVNVYIKTMDLKRDWNESQSGLSPGQDSTPTETELRMGLNLEFLSTLNGVQYNVKVYIYQKNGFKKRIHQSILVKKGYQGLNIRVQLHVEEG